MLTEHEEIEIQEAIDAADVALEYLGSARDYLSKASRWGIVDIIGGGPLITMIKRNNMKEARYQMEQARDALRNFSRELNDLRLFDEIDLDTDQFLGFADYFFDNPIMDFLVQNKITEASRQVEEAIDRVAQIQEELIQVLDNDGE